MSMYEASSLVSITAFIVALFVSISVHEMMHAFVAYRLGDDLAHSRGRISLNPMRHIDPVLTLGLPLVMILMGLPPILAAKPVPINTNRISGDELGLAAVGIAGPLTNLLLASITALIFNLTLSDSSGFVSDFALLFIYLNVGLFVFNMIPIPPLDGSRLLYALAPRGLQRVMEQIEQMGIFVALMILFFLIQFIGPVITSSNEYILNILIR